MPTSSDPTSCCSADGFGAVERDDAQRLVRRQAARSEVPRLPVRAQALQLPVAAERRRARPRGRCRPPAWRSSCGRTPPAGTTAGRRRTMVSSSSSGIHLRSFAIAGVFSRLEVEVLGPRRAVGDEDRRRVERLRARDELDHVLVDRHDRQAVLLARVAVGHLRQVQLQVERALDGGGDAVLLAASMSHCRTMRSPATYCLMVLVRYASL